MLTIRPERCAQHRPHGRLGAKERALEVGRQNRVPVVLAHPHHQRVARDAGVVDQGVDPSEFRHRALDQRAGLVGVGDVTGEDLNLAPSFAEALGRLVRFGFIAAVGDQQVEPFGRQPVGDGEADAPGPPVTTAILGSANVMLLTD